MGGTWKHFFLVLYFIAKILANFAFEYTVFVAYATKVVSSVKSLERRWGRNFWSGQTRCLPSPAGSVSPFKNQKLGVGMGNTCKTMADSCQCMTKTTTIL